MPRELIPEIAESHHLTSNAFLAAVAFLARQSMMTILVHILPTNAKVLRANDRP